MRVSFKKASPRQLEIMVWGFVFLVTVLSYLPMDGPAQALIWSFMSITFSAAIIYGNIRLLFPRLYEKGHIVLYILASIGLLLAVGVTRTFLSATIYNRYFAEKPEVLDIWRYLYTSIAGIAIFVLSFVFRIALAYFRLKRQAEQMLEQKSQAELNLLKSQVQPHFLFNTLNNIYYEAYRESPRTALLIGRLSDIMRYFVDESPREKVSLATEIKFLENYIALEEIRIRHGVTVNFSKQYDGDPLLPPMLLMTFVENLFKHGIDRSAAGNTICLSLIQEDGHLLFTTENALPGNAPAPTKPGFGLQNLEKRLTMLYGDRFVLSRTRTATHFKAFLKIPLA
ncbi:sensor histidine kinase [Puia sp.]|jgi:LytS/YehU family sensor histidine kinase|uniref:sensor histidine kinase n=1 Tax=Puia sp. TaxID=2045100 RepID=UPI002F411081